MKTKEIKKSLDLVIQERFNLREQRKKIGHGLMVSNFEAKEKLLLYEIRTLNEMLQAKQDKKAAKSKFKLVDIKHVPGFFDELQGWLDDISIDPCNEKFNPGAKCNEEKEHQKCIDSLKKDHEIDRLKLYAEYLYKKVHNLNNVIGELNKLSNRQFVENKKLKAENSALATKVCELTEVQLKAEEKESEKQENIIRLADIDKLNELVLKLKSENKQIAEQAGTITRLTNKLKENKYTKEDLNSYSEKAFNDARITFGIDGDGNHINKFIDWNRWMQSQENKEV